MNARLKKMWIFAPLLLWTTWSAADPRQDLAILDSRILDYPHSVSGDSSQLSDNLELTVDLADQLSVAGKSIKWTVTQKGVPVRELLGHRQLLTLPTGTYDVSLSIGQFSLIKQVDMRANQKVTPYFKADVGRLSVSANQEVDWEVRDRLSGTLAFTVEAVRSIDEIVPAGVYDVKTLIRDIPNSKRVFVQNGQAVSSEINIPVGQVNLIATQDDQPLFKPVEWKVFRLENGKRREVGSYHQHSQGITIPPGYYEVVATHNDMVRSRQFWVKENTSNQVVLAMDNNP